MRCEYLSSLHPCYLSSGALVAALLSLRSSGGLRHLHTLTLNESCKEDGMALLMVAWVRREAEMYHDSNDRLTCEKGGRHDCTDERGEREKEGDGQKGEKLDLSAYDRDVQFSRLSYDRRQSGVLRVEGMQCRGYALAELIEGMGLDCQLPGFNR